MVAFERAISELSSLVASVTLNDGQLLSPANEMMDLKPPTYMRELGFFFFLRMAVETSSPWIAC